MKKYSLIIGAVVLVLVLEIGGYFYLKHSLNPGDTSTKFPTLFITYTDSGFSPSSPTVIGPATVTFKNNSSKSFQPISQHGLVSNNPCISDQYGDCNSIPPGGSWSTGFSAGVWNYHDQLNPSKTMTINVLQGPDKGIPAE